ncbi:MAG: bifunctional folylpolyglutamate synthase/dihydrofolate synthase [Acidobacteriota bacterium]|nr:bifunctional folylpolyglutamate synthase/dihydrofolate synthase [Acidobacteriota bacterium]
MSYTAALEHLKALGPELAPGSASTAAAPRRKFDLAHMRTLAAALGQPQTRFASVLIAGTNGKGSTAATLASICNAAGYKTGLYTSPHLVRVNERIQISPRPIPDGAARLQPIADDDFARLFFQVQAAAQQLVAAGTLPHAPSYFETLTAMAFLYFAEQQVEIAILEVGMGGRLDATNIVEPLLSIITDIALDHMEYLGDTIGAITREKAGILRPGGTLITLPQHPEANQAIGEVAATLDLHAVSAADYIPTQLPSVTGAAAGLPARNHYTVQVAGEPLLVDSPLSGQHQQRNLALAIAAAVELRTPHAAPPQAPGEIRNQVSYKISNASIAAGIRATHWPGRLQLIPGSEPPVLVDVAHNPAGAWTLRAALAQLPEAQPRTLIFSCLRDKSLTEMARILLPLFDSSPDGSPSRPQDHIFFAPIRSPRAAPIEDLMATAQALSIPAQAAPDVATALAWARQSTPPGGIVIATGSVYLIGEIHEALQVMV